MVATIVPVSKGEAVLLLILNIFVPGLGTIINAFMAEKMLWLAFWIGVI